MFKTINEGFNWIVSFTNLEQKTDLSKRGYRLDKMHRLLELFDNPHKAYKIIHVAGSKGKGSTCGFLASILNSAGYKTGVYSSPHLLDYRERITENHQFFTDNTYLSALNSIKEKIEVLKPKDLPGGEPTTFELLTLLAFMIFRQEGCEWVVLETGIGGRLDSTNVVNPVASVITTIELEHTELLGETLEEIAYEKAGIIKRNRPTFASNNTASVSQVLNRKAVQENSKLILLPKHYTIAIGSMGTVLNYEGNSYTVGLQGEVQGGNALLALTTIKNLLPHISQEILEIGLKNVSIPGRFHIIGNVILDGAHTKKSIISTIKTFKAIYGEGSIIFGAVLGKDIKAMVKEVNENFNNIFISKPGNFKESNIKEIKELFHKLGKDTILIESAKEVLETAKQLGDPILVTGSFYMAGEIAKVL